VIVKSCPAEPNGGTANHHENRASRSELFCRRHFGASGLGKARSGQVRRPCTATRANGGRVGRYYDPTTGQFLSVDPLVGETGQPYAYTKDDPVNATDPLGDIPYVPTPGGEIVGGSLLVDAQEATKTAAATPKSGGSTTPSVPISGTPATVPISRPQPSM
jgi:RHS repeat-associated protein